MKTLFCAFAAATISASVGAQSVGIPIDSESREAQINRHLTNAIHLLRESGPPLKPEMIRAQLRRGHCQLTLPPVRTAKLTTREIRQRARQSHLRLGWVYLCNKCDEWHFNLAGGYVITADGAVATAYHVVVPPHDLQTGGLLTVDDDDKVRNVTEILAANRHADACIVKVEGERFTPLPLNTNISSGDAVYCLSDPASRPGFFSQGIANRIFQLPERRLETVPGAPRFTPLRIQVSAEWGQGSSGSVLLDERGNAIGHVSILTGSDKQPAKGANGLSETTFQAQSYEATSARDLMMLVRGVK
jgi:hypothetical protein